MEKFVEYLASLKDKDFKVSKSASGVETIQATQRNALKKEVTEAFYEVLKAKYPYTYKNSKGIMLEVENDSVADKIDNEEGFGGVSIRIDFVIPSLSTNPADEEEAYLLEETAKEKLKSEKEQAKQAKIKRDMKLRAEKAKAKQAKINQLKGEGAVEGE